MEQRLYSILDTVAKEFGPIFHAKNDGVALRNLHAFFLQNKQVDPREHVLYQLGIFNAESGQITPELKNIQADIDTQTDPGE